MPKIKKKCHKISQPHKHRCRKKHDTKRDQLACIKTLHMEASQPLQGVIYTRKKAEGNSFFWDLVLTTFIIFSTS